ncbi:flavin reductase family protein [Streptomyces niveus]|uniref:flavin reductase family protein n=1 Tax=Streptomyces niveus TaxID=193462 RepID=UPI001C3F96E6|nr:flavin reductase family protein [Streptomyces niveus]
MTVTVSSQLTTGIAPERFKNLFRRYPAGVVVVTADAGRGPVGFTATSLTSLSLSPPLVSFGIALSGSSWPTIERASSAVVNFIGAEQEPLARTFATSGIDRFAAPTAWHRLPDGEPVLDGVAGWLRLSVQQIVPAGDHRIVVGRVEDAVYDDSRRPLVFHDGHYLAL